MADREITKQTARSLANTPDGLSAPEIRNRNQLIALGLIAIGLMALLGAIFLHDGCAPATVGQTLSRMPHALAASRTYQDGRLQSPAVAQPLVDGHAVSREPCLSCAARQLRSTRSSASLRSTPEGRAQRPSAYALLPRMLIHSTAREALTPAEAVIASAEHQRWFDRFYGDYGTALSPLSPSGRDTQRSPD
jgi:hypothetical protein